mgnify:CR=1 FL=1
MNRWKAASIHLAISFAVLATIAGILLWRWYPPSLLELARADHLLLVLAAVDLTLGPLLTLVVYKAGKPSLRFDLTVIAVLQVAALLYGLSVFWAGRPVYLVGVVDRFELVAAGDLAERDLADAAPPFDRLPLGGLQTVGAVLQAPAVFACSHQQHACLHWMHRNDGRCESIRRASCCTTLSSSSSSRWSLPCSALAVSLQALPASPRFCLASS